MPKTRPTRLAKGPTLLVRTWLQLLRARAKVERLTLPPEDAIRLSAYCSLLGDPAVEQKAYWGVVSLFVKAKRIPLWSSALQSIPFDTSTFQTIAKSAVAYNEVAPGGRGLATSHFKLDAVLPVMAMVNQPHEYIQDCADEQLDHPGAVFHPNTLRYAQRHMRGLEGPLADDAARRQILARVETLSG